MGVGLVVRSGGQVGEEGPDDAGERRNYCRDERLPNPRWIPLSSRAARKIREIGAMATTVTVTVTAAVRPRITTFRRSTATNKGHSAHGEVETNQQERGATNRAALAVIVMCFQRRHIRVAPVDMQATDVVAQTDTNSTS